jgi:hypothetical protein
MTRHETADMSRLLLALSLFAFAAIALANEPTATDDTPSAKPGKPAASATSESEAPVAPATPSPVRSSTPRPALPRWHSLLPGMIR